MSFSIDRVKILDGRAVTAYISSVPNGACRVNAALMSPSYRGDPDGLFDLVREEQHASMQSIKRSSFVQVCTARVASGCDADVREDCPPMRPLSRPLRMVSR